MTEHTIEEIGGKVMQILLSKDNIELQQLRQQYEAADTEIERSETGFFIHFDVPTDIESIGTKDRTIIRGVYATMDCLQHGMDFILFVDDGALSMLEGYTHQEELPLDSQTLQGVQFHYSADDNSEE